MRHSEFRKYGSMLWQSGLIHMTAGNMSVRSGRSVFITHTGSLLGDLMPRDIVKINVANPAKDKGASSETPVHRAIYLANPGVLAIVHAHPPYATALSWDHEVIRTIDSDSLCIPEIPVVTDCPYEEGSACIARHFREIFKRHQVALIRGHGAFAVGKDLREAASRISMMENQCRILFFRRLLESKK